MYKKLVNAEWRDANKLSSVKKKQSCQGAQEIGINKRDENPPHSVKEHCRSPVA